MRLQILGSGGYYPNERRHTACVLLPEMGVVFDAGTAFFRVPEHLDTEELDIFLSHAHLDHVVGLTCALVPAFTERLKRMTVHAGQQCLDAICTHLFSEPVFPVVPPFEFVPLAERVPIALNGTLTHYPLNHPGGSTGFRIDWPDRSLAYITDTIADGSYLSFIHGVDVLIHECYFPDEHARWAEKTGHSFTTAVAHAARDAGVGRLLLVHVDPQRSENDPIGLGVARAIFPATELTEDRMVIEF
jgi:ribonuclease BN (tRNA processing enzyme)